MVVVVVGGGGGFWFNDIAFFLLNIDCRWPVFTRSRRRKKEKENFTRYVWPDLFHVSRKSLLLFLQFLLFVLLHTGKWPWHCGADKRGSCGSFDGPGGAGHSGSTVQEGRSVNAVGSFNGVFVRQFLFGQSETGSMNAHLVQFLKPFLPYFHVCEPLTKLHPSSVVVSILLNHSLCLTKHNPSSVVVSILLDHALSLTKDHPSSVVVSILLNHSLSLTKHQPSSVVVSILLNHSLSQSPHGFTLTWCGCCGLCLGHQPTELAHSFLFCSCVCFCVYGPFNFILFHKFFQQLPTFSLCSSGLNSALLVFQLNISFMKVSLSPDIILCSWLGLEHQLVN